MTILPRHLGNPTSETYILDLNIHGRRRKFAAYKELQQRMERHAKVSSLTSKMAADKELMGKGRKRKLKGSEVQGEAKGPVFKWKRERKK